MKSAPFPFPCPLPPQESEAVARGDGGSERSVSPRATTSGNQRREEQYPNVWAREASAKQAGEETARRSRCPTALRFFPLRCRPDHLPPGPNPAMLFPIRRVKGGLVSRTYSSPETEAHKRVGYMHYTTYTILFALLPFYQNLLSYCLL